jgi:cytochrome c oxidase cbb3-type subunit III
MTDRSPDVDAHSGVETTGHEWDGIKELNNPLPRWWLWVFYATVLVSIAYWVLLPAWPAPPGMQGHTTGVLGQSDRASVAAAVETMKAERSSFGARLTSVSAEAALKDPDLRQQAMALGESVFGDNCATCHGPGGRGAKGYPQLVDDVWLWGGSLAEIETTIQHGIRSGHKQERRTDMPAFGRDGFLTQAQIDDMVHFVESLSGEPADRAAVERARSVFAANQSRGVPNLADAEWLYGGDPRDVLASIYGPRAGAMPAWDQRLDPATVRALAIYVHSLGGGE